MKSLSWLRPSRPLSLCCQDYLGFTRHLVKGYRSRLEQMLAQIRRQDLSPYLSLEKPRRVLDLANGRLRPQYLLLRGDYHQVVGIDLANRPAAGFGDLAYSLARHLFVRGSGLPGRVLKNQQLICGDVGFLPFVSNTFDLATSVAAFEHFLEVDKVVAELARVLKPGGLVWIWIHLFTCPTGGHHFYPQEVPLRRFPKGVEPWDHLRERRLPLTVPLNEWRRDQYLESFARHFDLLKTYCALREGENCLTPELEQELRHYDLDELTCGGYVILARKPLSGEGGD